MYSTLPDPGGYHVADAKPLASFVTRARTEFGTPVSISRTPVLECRFYHRKLTLTSTLLVMEFYTATGASGSLGGACNDFNRLMISILSAAYLAKHLRVVELQTVRIV